MRDNKVTDKLKPIFYSIWHIKVIKGSKIITQCFIIDFYTAPTPIKNTNIHFWNEMWRKKKILFNLVTYN